ncbi:unnamed protein product [Polarella glacialis]|uniref:Phospholipid/glycerol acyltransferase domain-containing protein n=1 Tax=Polarella glacialis TaxID=89957 RepID=A0A813G6F9_POLGL|nr:unnamed protein product [Polarella glacialis]
MRPQRQLCPVDLMGIEELGAERSRLLFVGNHAILGIDVPLLIRNLFEKTGIWPRPLGEHAWFSVPFVGELLAHLGGVDGTRHNCDLLMERGHNLLVYPGGAREAWKRTTDKPYALLWGETHLGFARMAVKHGYTIVPVATVGTEDVIQPCADIPIQRILTVGGYLKPPGGSVGGKAFEQGARFPLVVPKPAKAQKVYFRLMPLVRTQDFQGQESDEDLLRSLRDLTRSRLEEGISSLLEHRRSDPHRFVFQKAQDRQNQKQEAAVASVQEAAAAASKL